jgi:extradiol dioxygenase family protein
VTRAKVSQFHLAFPVSDLTEARRFYGEVMGCPEGRCSDVYVDFDFYGHQIVAHIASTGQGEGASTFDGHTVPVPHFGLNLDGEAWHQLAARLKAHGVAFAEEPHQRLTGQVGQHLTMFLFDPFGNALEFKSFDHQGEAFLTNASKAAAG